MNTYYNEQNPAVTEQIYLNQLNNYQQRLSAYLASFTNNTLLSPEQLSALLQTLAQWESIFEGFAPYAQSLRAKGYPKLSQQLMMILNDFHTAVGIYQQMYQNALQTRSQVYGIWQNTQADILQGWQQTIARQQQVFGRSNKDMHAAMFGCCPRCGTYVGTYALCLRAAASHVVSKDCRIACLNWVEILSPPQMPMAAPFVWEHGHNNRQADGVQRGRTDGLEGPRADQPVDGRHAGQRGQRRRQGA